MKEILQNILFVEENYSETKELYYHGYNGLVIKNKDDKYICMEKHKTMDFSTYFNSLSNSKWRTYTNAGIISLELEIEGEFDLILCGYKLVNNIPEQEILKKQYFCADTRQKITSSFPENNSKIISFLINSYSAVKIYGGNYNTVFSDEQKNSVELALATTTCWKEKFITNNIEKLNKELLEKQMDISSHLTLHIVDNGRTLNRGSFPSNDRIKYYSNKNTGGSGGFARGMIEAQRQSPRATHVLLMDDDVSIIPDSIYRTYTLLKWIKDEYKQHFISGAMLLLEEMNIQHEDIGTVQDKGMYVPLKPKLNQDNLKNILINEEEYYSSNKYQAWWYCCIPMSVIDSYGLPLPLFIRGDDCEYSLRCKAKIISMNGICVWHMGFVGKYSASMNIYQESRNLLIAQATSRIIPEIDLGGKIKKFYRDNILKHDYNAAELALNALEDYMKGPEFLKNADGEKIVKENSLMNQKMEPLNMFKDLNVDCRNPEQDVNRTFFKTLLYRITFNGHRFYPLKNLGKYIVAIPFDFGYTPGKMAMVKTYLAVNKTQGTGCLKSIDKLRFKKLQKRYYRLMLKFWSRKKAIQKSYQNSQKELVSIDFWKEYLGI